MSADEEIADLKFRLAELERLLIETKAQLNQAMLDLLAARALNRALLHGEPR